MECMYLHSTEESVHCSSILLKSITQSFTMIDIARPMSIIGPHPPTQDSSSVPADASSDTDTLSPLSETPAAALATSDAFSSSSDIHPQCSSSVLALRQSSTLFVRALRRPLRPRPSSVRIRGTTFLSSIAELLPKIGTQFEMERKWRGNTKINTTINHRRTTTRARTNAGAVMSRGMDGEGGAK